VVGKSKILGKHEDVADPCPYPLCLNPWFSGLWDAFGGKLLIMLFASQHLMKGFCTSLVGPSTQYLLASYQVAGPRMQIFGGIIGLPWAMKPIIGMLSDGLPIRGYNKSPYILFASAMGILACAVIAKVPKEAICVEYICGCLFFMQLQASTCDLLTEAKYAEKMQAKPEKGPDLMTYVWFGLQVGGFLATLMAGPLMDHVGPKAPFAVALVPMAFIIVPVVRNYMEEKHQDSAAVAEARRAMYEQKEISMLCILMFVGTLLLTFLGMHYEDVKINCIAAISVALVMLIAFSVTLKPVIARVNAFFLVQTSLGFSIGGASFYFYTDGPEEYKDGPHFSMQFYVSVLGVCGSVCSLIGIWTYQQYMKDWKYRNLLLLTNIVASGLAVLDVIMLGRWNVKMGIPDHYFVLGSSVFQTIIGQWMWMPGVVILSQLCPKGMEATMYALLAGCHNLGNTIAASSGALVLQWLECSPSGAKNEGKQFDNLWMGSCLSTLLPMLTLFLIPYMIPDARQTDKLLDDNDRSATKGSLWKRWTNTDS